MAKLENVVIKFKCKHCKKEIKMTALDLLEAGNVGSPYCNCTEEDDDELDVLSVSLKKGKGE